MVGGRLAHGPGPVPFRTHALLTKREADVVRVLFRGRSVTDAADELGLSIVTVRMHVRNMHLKTGTRNLHSLVLWVLVHHLCCPLRIARNGQSEGVA